MDSLSQKVIYHQIVKTEKDVYYLIAFNRFIEKGLKIQSITCDDRRGILKNTMAIPTQMCKFHMVAIVTRKLRKKHQSEAGKEIVKTLKESLKNEFYIWLFNWYQKHKIFLEERSDKPNEKGYFSYKHRNVRGAYASLKRYMDYLFTFEKHSDLNIEKTTNRIEELFKELKQKLTVHNRLTKKHKIFYYTKSFVH